jgi:hypothetical protein
VEARASTIAGSRSIDGGQGRMRAGNKPVERKGERGRGRLRTPYVPAGGPPMLGARCGGGEQVGRCGEQANATTDGCKNPRFLSSIPVSQCAAA